VIEEVLAPAALDLERLAVREPHARSEPRAPGRQRLLRGGPSGREALGGHARNQVGVGRERQPDVALGSARDPGEVAIEAEQVGDDLQVQVRRPPAVLEGLAEGANALTGRDGLPRAEICNRRGGEVAVERVEN
jgi:hypothetical protein